MATEDARYRLSSQYRLWSFSPSQLASMREKSNALARASISQRLSSPGYHPPAASSLSTSSLNLSAPTSSTNTPDPEAHPSGTPSGPPPLPEFLTPAEELVVVTFYTSELLRAADHAQFSDEIKATSAAFFRRFYVTNSIMTYPPQEMLIVALFFGCKAEGAFMRITDFIKTFGREHPEEILAGEFLLCQGIRFAFDVKHPFRALRGAMMELRRMGIPGEELDKVERRAKEILRFSPLITDAYFHYTPSQIMLAAMSLADRGMAEKLITHTFHHTTSKNTDGDGGDTPGNGGTNGGNTGNARGRNMEETIGAQIRDKVLGAIESCREMLAKEMPERREHWTNKQVFKAHVQPIRKKLNKCKDPDRWNLVELQRARREQALKRADSEEREDGGGGTGTIDDDGAVFGDVAPQRDPKRRKVVAKGLEDPFGGPL
ncbi:cyclin-like protein [Diplogelasinospora grovesii]|uniref:Cyclin-like protein n=1 Tax=Diplogelasinospora grovesii TaxID=303347 RepID=A0AAN6NA72_9PEZI|nr:cyclin-like protein [Diplogelasinospora grovesii]